MFASINPPTALRLYLMGGTSTSWAIPWQRGTGQRKSKPWKPGRFSRGWTSRRHILLGPAHAHGRRSEGAVEQAGSPSPGSPARAEFRPGPIRGGTHRVAG